MNIIHSIAIFIILSGFSPSISLAGELALFKDSITDEFVRHPFDAGCSGIFKVNQDENVLDMRDFQYYFCQGIYSLTLDGPANTIVTLFGSFFYETDRGYLILRKTDDRKVGSIDLESLEPGKWFHVDPEDMRYGSYDFYYHDGPYFKRNISSVKWGKWWAGNSPSLSKN